MKLLVAGLLLAVLVVVTIAIVYSLRKDPKWTSPYYIKAALMDKPGDILRWSSGDFDEAAQLAYTRAMERAERYPEDLHLATRVITFNILEQGEQRRQARGLPLTERDAARNERMMNTAAAHMETTIARWNAPQRRPNIRIIDDIVMLVQQDFMRIFPDAAPLFGLIPERALEARRRAVADRRQQAQFQVQMGAAFTGTAPQPARGAVARAYVDLAVRETSDPQNTHDSTVLACERAIVDRLRQRSEGAARPAVSEIVADIAANVNEYSDNRPLRIADVLRTLEVVKHGDVVISLGASDLECLQLVWMCADDPRNEANRSNMRKALFNALYDCWEDGLLAERHLVCVNGRATRILSSITLLDWDQSNSVVMRFEQVKNDIFKRSLEVIEETAAAAAASPEPDRARAGRAYLAKTPAEMREVGDVEPAASAALAAEMREKIAQMVDVYLAELRDIGVTSVAPPDLIAAIKEEAAAAVVE
jgi:hypothetical protein